MIWDLFLKDKTLKGSIVMLVSFLLGKAGVDAPAVEVGMAVGAVGNIIGWIHKIIKTVKSK